MRESVTVLLKDAHSCISSDLSMIISLNGNSLWKDSCSKAEIAMIVTIQCRQKTEICWDGIDNVTTLGDFLKPFSLPRIILLLHSCPRWTRNNIVFVNQALFTHFSAFPLTSSDFRRKVEKGCQRRDSN